MIPYDRILIFFVYGLAFFSMGIAMALEAGRSPLLAEARVLRPLAAFGLLHGTYEWLVLFLFQMRWFDNPIPLILQEIRLGLLVLSFISLWAYGVQTFRFTSAIHLLDVYVGVGMLVVWGGAWWGSNWFIGSHIEGIERGDVLARYLLAVPGGLVAAYATLRQSRQTQVENQMALKIGWQLAAGGFALYGLSQIFVFPMAWGLADVLNMDTFREFFGFPIQSVRAGLALCITTGLIYATQVAEQERQRQFAQAQQARIAALDQVRVELVKQQAMRQEFLQELVTRQEAERARIARELHDETAQTLTAIRINLAALQNTSDPLKTRELFSRLHTFSDQIAKDIHRLVHELRPAQLDDLGLTAALEFLADEMGQNFSLHVTLQIAGKRQRLDTLIETVLYRVAQEALTNVVRHAQTQHAQVELHFRETQVQLAIRDQGCGFEFQTVPSGKGSLGLVGMRERVESVQGDLDLQTHPGRGTQLTVTIPLPPGQNSGAR